MLRAGPSMEAEVGRLIALHPEAQCANAEVGLLTPGSTASPRLPRFPQWHVAEDVPSYSGGGRAGFSPASQPIYRGPTALDLGHFSEAGRVVNQPF